MQVRPLPVRRLTALQRAGGGEAAALVARLTAALEPLRGRNPFNPSVLVTGDQAYVTLRAFRDSSGAKPFSAYLASCDLTEPGSAAVPLVDLTAHAAGHGVAPVADPKLFAVGDDVFATFNTGSATGGPNDVYVMRIAPTLGVPQRCVLAERNRIEKNWGFFDDGGGVLRALYSLHPVSVVRVVAGDLGGRGELTLAHEPRDSDAARFDGNGHPRGRIGLGRRMLSIGTQPIRAADGSWVLVEHEKTYIKRWQLYTGRAVRLTGLDTAHPVVAQQGPRLVHDLRSSVPRPGLHNPAAVLVTYFAGLTGYRGRYLLGYGIDDTRYGFALCSPEDLW